MSDDLVESIRLKGDVPRHVAIIMDGNGRWATERSLPRPLGHQAGMKAVRQVVEAAIEVGVEVLTLFAFSQENWQRPPEEIDALMTLLEEYIALELEDLYFALPDGLPLEGFVDKHGRAAGGLAAVQAEDGVLE